jgi:hypothetical protein
MARDHAAILRVAIGADDAVDKGEHARRSDFAAISVPERPLSGTAV